MHLTDSLKMCFLNHFNSGNFMEVLGKAQVLGIQCLQLSWSTCFGRSRPLMACRDFQGARQFPVHAAQPVSSPLENHTRQDDSRVQMVGGKKLCNLCASRLRLSLSEIDGKSSRLDAKKGCCEPSMARHMLGTPGAAGAVRRTLLGQTPVKRPWAPGAHRTDSHT